MTISTQFDSRKVEGAKAYGTFDEVFGHLKADGNIKCSRFLTFGTDASSQVKEVSAAGDKVIGFAIYQYACEQNDNSYTQGEHVALVKEGSAVYVKVTANVNAGDKAYIDLQTAGSIGQLTNVVTGNKEIKTAYFEASALAGEFATISFDLIGQ